MMMPASREYWEVWYPAAAATGLPIARCLIDPAPAVLLHSPPDVLTVEVRSESGERMAYAQDLRRTQISPMCRLRREGDSIVREDIWPDDSDLDSVVILPGGEAAVLKAWWHADDKKEWRWQVELYNSIR